MLQPLAKSLSTSACSTQWMRPSWETHATEEWHGHALAFNPNFEISKIPQNCLWTAGRALHGQSPKHGTSRCRGMCSPAKLPNSGVCRQSEDSWKFQSKNCHYLKIKSLISAANIVSYKIQFGPYTSFKNECSCKLIFICKIFLVVGLEYLQGIYISQIWSKFTFHIN